MRKYISAFVAFQFVMLVFCSTPSSGMVFSQVNSDSDDSKFTLGFDPRLELMAVIQSLSIWSDFLFTKLDFSYRDEVNDHFGKFKDHMVVRWMEEKLDARTWPGNMIFLSKPPEMEIIHDFPPSMVKHIGGEDQVRRMVDLMNQFVEDTDFMQFWEDRTDFYQFLEIKINRNHNFEQYGRLMSDFYGNQTVSLFFIPVPLFHNGGFSEVLTTNDNIAVYCFVGPNAVENNLPIWSDSNVRHLFFHELGHGFSNPAVDAHWDRFKVYDHFFRYIESEMRQKAYASWKAACYEHVLRACEIHLLRKAGYSEEADSDLSKCINDGFQFVPFMLDEIAEYSRKRDQYHNFKDFIPRLIDIFDDLEPYKTVGEPGTLGIDLLNEGTTCIITTVNPESVASRAGLQRGDQIKMINDQPTNLFRSSDLKRLEGVSKPGDVWTIIVLRGGREFTVKLKVPFNDRYEFRKKSASGK